MDVEALRAAVESDVRDGVKPVAIVATVGTTATASVDDVDAIAAICEKHGIWLHVDAAYGGSAMIDPRKRHLWRGIERADSIVTNPHKWLFTPFDCGVMFTRRPDALKETFSLVPEYLKTSEQEVINYMDYGLQLGRRFRALKLWMVLQHYGLRHLREVINGHIELAARLAEELRQRDDAELIAPQMFSVVVFRKLVRRADGSVDDEASEKASEALVQKLNESGELFLATTRLRGKFAIRVAIGHGLTEWRHVEKILTAF
jgi:aromatic-L-amino-acid decarboxylase